ncbi:MAG: DUF2490 domain-containing protein [Ferruginibacter sp.]
MNNFKKALAIFCSTLVILLIQLVSFAQSKPKEVTSGQQTWFSVNTTARVKGKFGFIADVHVRRRNFLANPDFYFTRAALNYWLKENVTVAAGYAQLWMAPSNPSWHHFALEKRIYQQVQMTSKTGKLGLLNRMRVEQRWQQKIVDDKFINAYKFSTRVRYLLSLNFPFSKNPSYPSLTVADELSIQFGKEIVYNTFDQNRIFVGIRQRISKSLNADFGYMVVYQQKASGYQYTKNHTLRCFFYYTPDFRKVK